MEARHAKKMHFVDHKVWVNDLTQSIILRIAPYFEGKRARVISGYLTEEQLYWKVNYHWEYLLHVLDGYCEACSKTQAASSLNSIRNELKANAPDPSHGYRTSSTPGHPRDRSSHDDILCRHALVSHAKREFKRLVDATKASKETGIPEKHILLAQAPVAQPAKGRHSTGYALDIEGDNLMIKRICHKLNASLVFDEGSHVHVEFAPRHRKISNVSHAILFGAKRSN